MPAVWYIHHGQYTDSILVLIALSAQNQRNSAIDRVYTRAISESANSTYGSTSVGTRIYHLEYVRVSGGNKPPRGVKSFFFFDTF